MMNQLLVWLMIICMIGTAGIRSANENASVQPEQTVQAAPLPEREQDTEAQTYAEPVAAPETPQAYLLYFVDQEQNPVPEVYANFCTEASCVVRESDENGMIAFTGAPEIYHVQIIDLPDGYSADGDFELYTGREYGAWMIHILKE